MDALLSLGLRFLPPLIVSLVVLTSLLTVYYWLEKRYISDIVSIQSSGIGSMPWATVVCDNVMVVY